MIYVHSQNHISMDRFLFWYRLDLWIFHFFIFFIYLLLFHQFFFEFFSIHYLNCQKEWFTFILTFVLITIHLWRLSFLYHFYFQLTISNYLVNFFHYKLYSINHSDLQHRSFSNILNMYQKYQYLFHLINNYYLFFYHSIHFIQRLDIFYWNSFTFLFLICGFSCGYSKM